MITTPKTFKRSRRLLSSAFVVARPAGALPAGPTRG